MSKWLVVLCILGCGGGKPAATASGEGAEDKRTCEPGRCLEDIAAKVQENRATARACYDANPTPGGGRVIVNFTIDPTGKVVEASQSVKGEQITDELVVACIVDAIKEIEFAPSAKGKRTKAYHTFEFAPR